MAIKEQKTKYRSQFISSTKYPEVPDKNVLGNDISAVINANCVAVKFFDVMFAMNARYAVYPIPAARFSKLITVISMNRLLPV